MERRWHKVWPVWAPKTLDVQRPVSEYVREWARYAPHRIAINFYGRDITYGELDAMIDKLAWGLVDLGVKKGDRVAVHMENCPQFVVAYFAAQRAGAIVVPVNPMFKAAELEHEMNDSGSETLIGFAALYPELEKVRKQTRLKNIILTSVEDFIPPSPIFPPPEEAGHQSQKYADTIDYGDLLAKSRDGHICNVTDMSKDLAVLQYTGGTTGTPKGAMITHDGLAASVLNSFAWYRHREDDVILGVTPFFHIMGQVQLMGIFVVCGGRLVIFPRFTPSLAAKAVTHYGVTFWVAAPPMIIGLLNLPELSQYNLTSFRCIATGGAPIPVELQAALKKVAPNAEIVDGYGLTETISSGGACTPLFQYRPGFVGIPQIEVDIRIMDQETRTKELPPNQEGEIVIKARAMLVGYWNTPEETKEMLRDGWLYTGDTGLMDEDGYIKFLGRTRELIKCSGFSVFPAEVEGLLFKHPAVKDIAVIGVNDPYRGESPKAFVVLKADYLGKVTEQELLEWSKDNMAAYKRPKFIEFRKELPKNNAGKLLRRVLVAKNRQRRSQKQGGKLLRNKTGIRKGFGQKERRSFDKTEIGQGGTHMFEGWKLMVVGGGGTMGSGIALIYAISGFETIVVDQNDEFLARAENLIANNAEFLVKEKLASEKDAERAQKLITYVKESDLEKVASKVDLALETIFENADAKRSLFAKLDKYCRPDCIFCSNTSASNVFEIAKISHPERFLITHWFNPPFIMGLVEIVMGPDTSESVVEKVRALHIKLGKNPAVIKQYIPGFIVNRLANALMREASYMVSKGWTTPQDIDVAVRETNGVRYAFEGPMALYDIVGWDLVQTVALDLFRSLCNDTEGGFRMAPDMIKKGELGLKSEKGAYDYTGVDPAKYMSERSARILKMCKAIKNL